MALRLDSPRPTTRWGKSQGELSFSPVLHMGPLVITDTLPSFLCQEN